jgi:hypothetical protein
MTVWPVLESIRVVTGSQRQETVLEFSCLVTTQCSMTSAVAGGNWLRTGAGAGAGACTVGAGVAATGFFLGPQPTRHKIKIRHSFFMRTVVTTGHYNPVRVIEPIAIGIPIALAGCGNPGPHVSQRAREMGHPLFTQ